MASVQLADWRWWWWRTVGLCRLVALAMNDDRYFLGWAEIRVLRRAALQHGASEAELACIARLEAFEAWPVDVERLAPLARLAGLPWTEMFPSVRL